MQPGQRQLNGSLSELIILLIARCAAREGELIAGVPPIDPRKITFEEFLSSTRIRKPSFTAT
jgi:hypothetical protein